MNYQLLADLVVLVHFLFILFVLLGGLLVNILPQGWYVPGMGLVSDVLGGQVLEALPGEAAIGQVRYSTTGDSNPANAQPFLITHHRGPIAVAHNGNLVDILPNMLVLLGFGVVFFLIGAWRFKYE